MTYILRTAAGSRNYVEVPKGISSGFNCKRSHAYQFTTKGAAQKAMREIPVRLMIANA